MAAEMIMAQVDGANQASQILAMSGKTFTVGKVSAMGDGVRNMLTLTPTGNAGMPVAIKLEGARQMGDLAALTGKTVTIAKPAMMAGGATNWLAIQPVTAGAAKVTASSATLVKLEGTRQGMQAASLTGQKFTVVQPMMAGKGAGSTLFLQPAGGGNLVALKMANGAPAATGLVGKSVTVGKMPLVAGGKAGTSWLVLKPTAAATAAKSVTAGTAVAATTNKTAVAATANGAVKIKTVAMTTPMAATSNGSMAAAKSVAAGKAATGAAAGKATVGASIAKGTIWKGTGLGLGLGLGLGIWGPVILAGVGTAAIYGYVRSRKEDDSGLEAAK